ncbi:MAG: LysM peptidoglycan-binding domain-containing protein [Phycisphaerae bacterium]
MRTEVKLTVVVVLVAVIGAATYFFGKGGEPNYELTPSKPLVHTVAPQTDDLPLPLGPGKESVTIKPAESMSPATQPSETGVSQETPAGTEKNKTILKIDLNRLSGGTASRPATITPNQPARIDINTIAEKSTPVSEPAPATVHVVKPGEKLFQIAEKYYGRGELWRTIAKANRNINPDALRTGMKLTIPPSPRVHVSESLPSNSDKSKHKTYKVKSGETFYSIAGQQLGSASRWKEIYELNKSKVNNNPRNLRDGQTIYLPNK